MQLETNMNTKKFALENWQL